MVLLRDGCISPRIRPGVVVIKLSRLFNIHEGGILMARRLLIAFNILLALGCSSKADQITLYNGDRLTGMIVKSDRKQLTMNTDYAGQVTVQWEAVQTLSSTARLHLQMKDGRTLV